MRAVAAQIGSMAGQRWQELLREISSGMAVTAFAGLYVILAPSLKLLPVKEVYDSQRLAEVLVVLATGLALIGSARLRAGWLRVFFDLPGGVRWGLAAVFVLGCVSSSLAVVPVYAFLEVAHYALLFCLAITIACAYRETPDLCEKLLVGVVVASVSLYLLSFATVYLGHLAGTAPLWPRSLPGFFYIRVFNHYQTWTLPVLAVAAVLLPPRTGPLRYILGGVAALWWTLLFASGGRGTLLGVVVALIVTGSLFRRHALAWAKLHLSVTTGGALLFFVLFKLIVHTDASVLERDISTDSGRLVIWQDALEMVREQPVLGVGPMHYAYYFVDHPLAQHYPAFQRWGSPHNVPMQWAVEWGVPAMILLLLVLGWGFVQWAGKCRREMLQDSDARGDLLRAAITASLIAAAVDALFGGIINPPLGQIQLALTTGWALGMYLASEGGGEADHPRWSSSVLCALAVFSLCVMSWVVAQDVQNLEKRQSDYIEHSDSRILWPRFWQQGFFGYGDY